MGELQIEKTRISNPIDFDRDGKQAGYLRAPLSRNTSGWGVVEIPIISVKNGSGPTPPPPIKIHPLDLAPLLPPPTRIIPSRPVDRGGILGVEYGVHSTHDSPVRTTRQGGGGGGGGGGRKK